MADWLLIRLPRKPGMPASWLVADGAGRIVVPPQDGPLARAAVLAPSRRICALVPAEDVVHAEVDVPAKAGPRAREIVPFALEEQLAEDIESLHFAIGRRPPGALRTPVAVASHASMEQWLAELTGAGLTAEALYAESDLVPANPGQAVALLESDRAIVREAGRSAVTMPIDALAEALSLVLPPADAAMTADRTGHGLLLYTGAEEWHRHSATVEALRDRFDGIKVQLLTDGSLPLLAQRLPSATSSAVNLLQGSYAAKTTFTTDWRTWRVAAILIVTLVLLHTAGNAIELVSIHHREQRVEAAIVRTFREAMPGDRNPIDARRRMEQRLESLGRDHETGLLAALGALASANPGAAHTVLRMIDYQDGRLDLAVSAPNPEMISQLTQRLRAAGWQAQLTAGHTVGSHYEGHVRIQARS